MQVDDVFEFTGGAGEPVHMPAHDRVDPPGRDVGPQPQPFPARFAGVRGHVVVGIQADHVPAVALAQGAAVLFLAGRAEAGAGPVGGDPHVDRSADRVRVAAAGEGGWLLCGGLHGT